MNSLLPTNAGNNGNGSTTGTAPSSSSTASGTCLWTVSAGATYCTYNYHEGACAKLPSTGGCTVLQTYSGSSCTYFATGVPYCSAGDNSCDNGTILNGTGTSGAYNACSSMNSGAGTCGRANWRVPTKNELKILISCTDKTMPNDGNTCGTGNYSSPSINNSFPNTQSEQYWSSSAYDTSQAWFVNFGYGNATIGMFKSFSYWVRCISGP